MKMLIILAGGAFALSLAGGAAVRVMTAPPPDVVTASMDGQVEGDSTAVPADGEAHAESPGGAAVKNDAAHRAADAAAKPEPHAAERLHDAPAATVKEAVPLEQPAPPAAPTPEESMRDGMEQLAKILGSMKAADAARILAFLQDDHIEGILQSLSVRQAASILTQLPPERAARLSRRLIENPKQETP